MPRNAAGNYTLPLPPVVTGTTIVASFENTTDSDIATELTNSLDRNGRGGMLAPFKIADGTVSAPGIAFTLDPDNGFYRVGADDWAATVGGVKKLEFSASRLDVTGDLFMSGGLLVGGGATISGSAGLFVTNGPVTAQSLVVSGAASVAGGAVLTRTAVNIVDGTGQLTVIGSTGGMASASGDRARLIVQSTTGTDGAFMAFNRVGGIYASYFGLDTDNTWRVGGWSAGNVAYRLLHEGNSFTLGAGLTTGLDLICKDLTTHRGNNSGVLYLGDQSGGPRFLFYDGSKFVVQDAAMICASLLGVNTTTTPIATFDVKVAANNHFIAQMVTYPNIGAINDAGSAWLNLSIGGGASAVVPTYDNTTTLGFVTPNRWSAVYATNGAIQTSDARQKKNIAPSTLGLAFLEDLNPVSYQWITESNTVTRIPDHEEQVPESIDIDGNVIPATTRTVYADQITPVPGTRTHWGLVAQDVKNAVVAAGVDFAGLYEGDAQNPEMGLAYSEFIAPLIKAVQELSARVKLLEGKPA